MSSQLFNANMREDLVNLATHTRDRKIAMRKQKDLPDIDYTPSMRQDIRALENHAARQKEKIRYQMRMGPARDIPVPISAPTLISSNTTTVPAAPVAPISFAPPPTAAPSAYSYGINSPTWVPAPTNNPLQMDPISSDAGIAPASMPTAARTASMNVPVTEQFSPRQDTVAVEGSSEPQHMLRDAQADQSLLSASQRRESFEPGLATQQARPAVPLGGISGTNTNATSNMNTTATNVPAAGMDKGSEWQPMAATSMNQKEMNRMVENQQSQVHHGL